MTTKNIGRITQCVKECWWRIGILLTIILGFIFLIVHGWPNEDLSVVDLLTSVGVVSSSVAVIIAILQLKYAREEDGNKRERYKKTFCVAAERDLVLLVGNSRSFQRQVEANLKKNFDYLLKVGLLHDKNYGIVRLEAPTIKMLLPTFSSLPELVAAEYAYLLNMIEAYNDRLEKALNQSPALVDPIPFFDWEAVRDLLSLSYDIEKIAESYIFTIQKYPPEICQDQLLALYNGTFEKWQKLTTVGFT